MNTSQEDISLIESERKKSKEVTAERQELIQPFQPLSPFFKTDSFGKEIPKREDYSNDIKKFIEDNALTMQDFSSACSNDISYQGSLEEVD